MGIARKKEVASMSRIKVILAVSLTVAVLMLSAAPAMARSNDWGNDNWGNNWNRNSWNNWNNSWWGNNNPSCNWYWSFWNGWSQWCWSPWWGWYQR